MWGGRFTDAPDALFRAFNDSLPIDWALVTQDILGSVAWARALGRAGVLTDDEVASLATALDDIATSVRGQLRPPPDADAEDIHTWVEQQLIARVGDLGKKLHTGRSRNDQVSTDFRLWVREHTAALVHDLHALQAELIGVADRERDTIMPGYTHLQRAQPIVAGHWALAYFEMLDRDIGRIQDAADRADRCPLGAAALAGTAYAIDRKHLSDELGFAAPTDNSLDTVADRDFAVELLAAAALCATHLSRLAEELIVWASSEFGFVSMSDAVTSGSSIMPQKKNPDALELIRGKAPRIAAHHAALLGVLKALPLAYNKDMQEDKAPVFTAVAELTMCVRMATKVVTGLSFDRNRCRDATLDGFTDATELADYLVERGVPFRDAHHQVGSLVRLAIEHNKRLEDLTIEAIREHAPEAGPDVFDRLTPESAVARRDVLGGTAPSRVATAIDRAHARLVKSGYSFSHQPEPSQA
ncbi:MAG: argininosuccinate lyase [Planctomycetota bacterium]